MSASGPASGFPDGSMSNAVLAAMQEINTALLTGTPSSDSAPLQVVARHARGLADADIAAIAAPTHGDAKTLIVRVADGANADRLIGTEIPIDGSIAGQVLTRGSVIVTEDAQSDPLAYHPMARLAAFGPVVIAPLHQVRVPVGALLVGKVRGRPPFSEHDRDLVAAFATEASIVLHLARSEQALLTMIDTDRRARVARELHDTVMQRLFGIAASFQALAAGATTETGARFESLIGELDATITQIRSTIFEQPDNGLDHDDRREQRW